MDLPTIGEMEATEIKTLQPFPLHVEKGMLTAAAAGKDCDREQQPLLTCFHLKF